jgi:hypothetical protein
MIDTKSFNYSYNLISYVLTILFYSIQKIFFTKNLNIIYLIIILEMSFSGISEVEDPIISLIKAGYYPDYVKIDQGYIPSFNNTLSRLYLRKGSHAVIVPAGYEWFVISYYNLKTIAKKVPIKVFLSYPRADLWLAYKIQKILAEAGIFVYLAELYPEPGVTLWEKIKGMIQNSDVVIVLWTKNAKNSAFVNQELGCAEALNKLIIPLVEQGVAPKGLLVGREYIPYRRGRDAESFSMLCNALYKFLLRKMKKKRNNK